MDTRAQVNLVPNFSFEQYDTCPSSANEIPYSTGWSVFSDINSTPDYYNSCAPSTGFSVPDNVISYQPDHRGCNAYAGIVTWASVSNSREYIGIQLSQPLIIGQKYFISFYAVMGSEKVIAGNYYEMPSNNIGLRLSTVAYNQNNPCPTSNWAHLNYSSILNDSINWTRISGSVIADSTYNYLIIGNFFDDANTDTLHYTCANCLNNYAYYLIDDVCLSADSILANGGIDTFQCATSMPEIFLREAINIFPNPTSNFISVSFEQFENYEIAIYDILGNSVYSGSFTNENEIKIDLSTLPVGIYELKICYGNKSKLFTKKIIKS